MGAGIAGAAKPTIPNMALKVMQIRRPSSVKVRRVIAIFGAKFWPAQTPSTTRLRFDGANIKWAQLAANHRGKRSA